MPNFDFFKKRCPTFQEKPFSCYILLTDQISLPDCLYYDNCLFPKFLNLSYRSNRAVFPHDQNVKTKI